MDVKAITKNVRISPIKLRLMVDLIRGKNASDALNILTNYNSKPARIVKKTLDSAIANAVNNQGAKKEDLVVSECYVNPGMVLKRIKFASRGNVDRRDKRTSHITVKVSDNKKGKEGA